MRRKGTPHYDYGLKHAQSRIVFVHGFRGDGLRTWGKFPTLIEKDRNLAGLSITSWGYNSNFLRCPGLQIVGQHLITELQAGCSSFSRIILVGHSIGGLVLLGALTGELMELQGLNPPMNRVVRIALFATPLDGFLVRRVIRGLICGPLGWFARIVLRNSQLRDLHQEEVVTKIRKGVINRIYLPPVGTRSTSHRHVAIHAFVAENDGVVTESAASGWIESPAPRSIPNTDHTSIKLPTTRHDVAYKLLCDVIEESMRDWLTGTCRAAINAAREADRLTAMDELLRAYEHCLQERLLEVRSEASTWSARRRDREQRKLMAIALRLSSRRPEIAMGTSLDHAMYLYQVARR